MAVELDRKRPYGSVCNDPEGRAFEQDERFFCADGSLWSDGVAPARKKKAEPPADQVEAQLEQPA